MLLSATVLYAQTKNLGLPYSYNPKYTVVKEGIKLPFVNNNEQATFYAEKSKKTGEKNLKYGFPHEVSIDYFDRAHKQNVSDNSTLYQLLIESKDAVSLNVIFDNFHLAEGTVMYLFSEDKTSFIGAYTGLNNNASNELGTELLYHDKIIIEVYEPLENQNKSKLSISRVIHGFIHLDQTFNKALNDAGGCNIDVNCPQGDAWKIQRNSVAMLVDNSGGFCSGAMINNTSNSLIPYFLTADHCGNSPGSWVFRFRWEAPEGQTNCGMNTNSSNGPVNMNINGGITRARYTPSDFHLIELNSMPDTAWKVSFAGWDRTGKKAVSGAGIHHPKGDIKKISLSNSEYAAVPYLTGNANHWKVLWAAGVTEGGSSGSPLFNQNRRIVGQLQGGASVCGGQDLSDYYGMFSVSWEGGGTATSRLKNWLDPDSTGAEVINANVLQNFDPFLLDKILGIEAVNCQSSLQAKVVLSNGGSKALTSAVINYSVDGIMNSINWSGNLVAFQTDTVFLPLQNLTSGNHTLEVSINSAGSLVDEVVTNNQTAKSFSVIANGELVNLNLSFDCYANETSWNIQNTNNTIIYSGSGYNNNAQQAYTINQKFCLAEECYTFHLFDEYGDGMFDSNCGVRGTFNITTNFGDTICQLPASESAFGDSIQKPFCISNFSGVEELNGTRVELYPNPFENNLHIKSSGIVFKIEIYDAVGKLIQTIEELDNLYGGNLNLMLSTGIYTIRLITEYGLVQKKLIKS